MTSHHDWEETKIIDRDSNPFTRKVRRLFKFVNGGQRHSTATMVCTLSITYIIHCCLELNFLGMMLLLQELTSAGKAVENTCDQDLSPRGRKLKLWVYFIGFVQHNFYQLHLIVICPLNSKIASKFRKTKRFLSYWSKQHFDCFDP